MSKFRFHHALLVAAALAPAMSHAATTTVSAHLNGDDQWRMHLSDTPSEQGFQYVNGEGWNVTYPALMLLNTDGAGNRYKDYWINILVQDIGGGGPNLLGEFHLTGDAGCKFDNGTKTLLTDPAFWTVTEGLNSTWSMGHTHVGWPSYATDTYLIPWVPPTLTPDSLGVNNGTSAYPVMPQISASAQWLSSPGEPNNYEAGYQAHIRCKP